MLNFKYFKLVEFHIPKYNSLHNLCVEHSSKVDKPNLYIYIYIYTGWPKKKYSSSIQYNLKSKRVLTLKQ